MKPLLKIEQVAELLNCSCSCVYAWAQEGKIPVSKLNGIWRFDLREIEAWVEQNKRQPIEPRGAAKRMTQSYRKGDVDKIVSRAVASAKGSRYNALKGKPDRKQAQEGGM